MRQPRWRVLLCEESPLRATQLQTQACGTCCCTCTSEPMYRVLRARATRGRQMEVAPDVVCVELLRAGGGEQKFDAEADEIVNTMVVVTQQLGVRIDTAILATRTETEVTCRDGHCAIEYQFEEEWHDRAVSKLLGTAQGTHDGKEGHSTRGMRATGATPGGCSHGRTGGRRECEMDRGAV